MATYTDQDWYDALARKYGQPAHPHFPSQTDLAKWQEKLPDSLLNYWEQFGWGGFSDGQYWLCNPSLLMPVIEEVFTGDPDFFPEDLTPFGYNAFGVIDIFIGRGRTMTLDLPFGTVTWRDQSINTHTGEKNSDFLLVYRRFNSAARRLDWDDEEGAPLFPQARESLGTLGKRQMYGFVPAVVAGGANRVENLQIVPLVEHLVFLAEIKTPTLYDYLPSDDDGIGTLVPRRLVGPQN